MPAKLDVRLLILLRAGVKAERRAAGRQHRTVWHLGLGAANRARGVTTVERVSNMVTTMFGVPAGRPATNCTTAAKGFIRFDLFRNACFRVATHSQQASKMLRHFLRSHPQQAKRSPASSPVHHAQLFSQKVSSLTLRSHAARSYLRQLVDCT